MGDREEPMQERDAAHQYKVERESISQEQGGQNLSTLDVGWKRDEDRPLKVIHVIGGGEFGGAEQHIIQLLSLMPREGVRGKVVCFYEAGLSQALRERGIEVEVLRYGRFDWRLLSGLKEVFRRDQPDIIHTHGVKANFFARLAAREMEHIPLVTTVHSMLRFDYENRLAYTFTRMMENSTRRYNSHFIAVSNALRRSLIEEGVPMELVTAVHHGIDVEAFTPAATEDHAARRAELRAAWGLPTDAYVIGVVGRLVRIKGVDYVIRALPRIVRANPRAHLIIIGSGPEQAGLKQLAAQLGLSRHVVFAGFRQDIADCMRAIDCFVSASMSEGLGLNVLEAMASGLPVVVTGVGGILDFTEHEVNGLVIEPRSSDQLADALIRLMGDPELAARLGRTAREHVERHFSLAGMGRRTVSVYRKLLEIADQIRRAEQQPGVKKLVISGYYGYGNNGDEAVLHAVLQSLRQAGEKQNVAICPIVLSVNPRATEQMHGVKAISRMNLLNIARELRRSDGLVSGGGSLLQDITGRMTIPYYLSIIKLAQWFGKPTFIYAQGVGPIGTKSFYPFIRYIYNQSEYVSVRDQESGELLREIGISPEHIDVVSDPVMGLADLDLPSNQVKRVEEPLIIGISVRFWHPYREELKRLAEALRHILDAEPRARLRFLPFYLPIDVEASRYVMDQLGPEHLRRTDMYADAIYPQDMLEQVAGCDLLIGMRLHSLIYAAAKGVPLIGISYDPKIDHFLHQLGMKAAASTDELNPYEVAREALDLLHDREAWGQEKFTYIEELKQKSLQPAQQICASLRK